MVGTHADDMIGEIALAIEMGAAAIDIGKTIHPHPTRGESIGMAAEMAHGLATVFPRDSYNVTAPISPVPPPGAASGVSPFGRALVASGLQGRRARRRSPASSRPPTRESP